MIGLAEAADLTGEEVSSEGEGIFLEEITLLESGLALVELLFAEGAATGGLTGPDDRKRRPLNVVYRKKMQC